MYKAASLVTNGNFALNLFLDALKKAISMCVPDADIFTICQEIDKFMEEGVSF